MLENTRTVGEPLLEVEDLSVSFKVKRPGVRNARVRAVRDVSFVLREGETLGLVGESGSGKSTLGRAAMRLIDSDSGKVRLLGRDLSSLTDKELRRARRNIQMVFQDPYSSLDPSMTVGESICEPLVVHEPRTSREELDARAIELLELVGLSAHHLRRYPYEFSGGQRQRIAIARAIALRPKVVVLDEAVSALDVSTQHQIIELMENLREELGLSYLFIAHDLAVVQHISDRVAVMYLGQVVEVGPTARIFADPRHPYTRALLSAVPLPDPVAQRERERTVLTGELPDPANVPPGCPFATRCPDVMEVCRTVAPVPVRIAPHSEVMCHLAENEVP